MPDIVVGRDGSTLTGRVVTDPIKFKTGFGSFDFKKRQVWRIHVRLDYANGQDEIVLRSGDTMLGELKSSPIRFRRAGGEEIKIPKDMIHTVHLGNAFDKNARALSEL